MTAEAVQAHGISFRSLLEDDYSIQPSRMPNHWALHGHMSRPGWGGAERGGRGSAGAWGARRASIPSTFPLSICPSTVTSGIREKHNEGMHAVVTRAFRDT